MVFSFFDPIYKLKSISRREFLSILSSATLTALVGCSNSPNNANDSSDDTPKDDKKYYVINKENGKIIARKRANNEILTEGLNAEEVIQTAINKVPKGATLHLKESTYIVKPPRITLASNIELKGDGIGKTVLKLADEINQDTAPILEIPNDTNNVTVRDLEIDGNERNNRDISPFPDSPPGHGLIVGGTESNVKNILSHNTIRSNVVVNGKNCNLEDLALANSATDHWLYITDGEECSIKSIHASGFARGSGIVFGVGERTCHDNELSDVQIENTQTIPRFEDEDPLPGDIRDFFPTIAINFRPAVNTANNTVDNVVIRSPQHKSGHQIYLGHPGSYINNVEYEGPAGYWRSIVTVDDTKMDTSGNKRISNLEIDVTESITEATNEPAIILSYSDDLTMENINIENAEGANIRGISFNGKKQKIEDNLLKKSSIETTEPIIVADGSINPVSELILEEVIDVNDRGISTKGKVTFETKDISSP